MVRQDIPDTDTPLLDMVVNAHEELASELHESRARPRPTPSKIADIYTRLQSSSTPIPRRSRAAILLTGLGFREHQLRDPFSSLSGGWRMRVALAAALFVAIRN